MGDLPLDIIDVQMQRIWNDMPVNFTVARGDQPPNTNTYQGTLTTPDFSQTLVAGGFEEKIEFNLAVQVSRPPGFPAEFAAEKTIVRFVDVPPPVAEDMRIVTVRRSPDNGQMLMFGLTFAKRRPVSP